VDKRRSPIVGARVSWRSIQPDIAAVDDRGVVTGRRAGRAAVVASVGTVTDTASIEVESRPVLVVQPERRDSTGNRTPNPPAKDSTETPRPVLTPAGVEPLFRELANAITTRSNARITSIYSEGGTAADSRLQRDFLKFVRDAEPKCAVRSVAIGSTGPGGSAVTGVLGCTWRNNAGIPYDRVASFSATAVSSGTGLVLRDVRLAAKFW
jgi:hypothetical protein